MLLYKCDNVVRKLELYELADSPTGSVHAGFHGPKGIVQINDNVVQFRRHFGMMVDEIKLVLVAFHVRSPFKAAALSNFLWICEIANQTKPKAMIKSLPVKSPHAMPHQIIESKENNFANINHQYGGPRTDGAIKLPS